MTAALESVLGNLGAFLAVGLGHGTVLAALTALLCATALSRARPALVTALWTVVLIKFVVPIGPPLPVSVSAMIDAVMATAPAAGPVVVDAGSSAEVVVASPASAGPSVWLVLSLVALAVYLGIVGWLTARVVSAQRHLRRQVCRLEVASGAQAKAVRRAAGVLGLPRVPEARVCSRAPSPYIAGVLRPVLVMPAELQGAALDAALVHELAHLLRRDTWLRSVQLVVGIALFFWPVVGWVNRRIDEAREMACDRWAVTRGHVSPSDYARVLVTLARRGCTPSHAGASFFARRGQLRRRVASILSGPSEPRLDLMTGGALAIWVALSLGGAPASRAVADGELACVFDPDIVEYLLVAYPEADADGDGELSPDEVCAQKERLRRIADAGGGYPQGFEAPQARSPEIVLLPAAMRERLVAQLVSELPDCKSCQCSGDEAGEGRPTGMCILDE